MLHTWAFRLTSHLRIPDTSGTKIAQICNLWTLWPVIQLINQGFLSDFEKKKMFISGITGHTVQRLQIFAIFA